MSISLVKPVTHTSIVIDNRHYEYFEDYKGTDILVYTRDNATGVFTFIRRVYIPKKGSSRV